MPHRRACRQGRRYQGDVVAAREEATTRASVIFTGVPLLEQGALIDQENRSMTLLLPDGRVAGDPAIASRA